MSLGCSEMNTVRGHIKPLVALQPSASLLRRISYAAFLQRLTELWGVNGSSQLLIPSRWMSSCAGWEADFEVELWGVFYTKSSFFPSIGRKKHRESWNSWLLSVIFHWGCYQTGGFLWLNQRTEQKCLNSQVLAEKGLKQNCSLMVTEMKKFVNW